MTREDRDRVSKISTAAHERNRQVAVETGRYVFDETVPEVGLSGGSLIGPDGIELAYVFTYREGWRNRILSLIEHANAALAKEQSNA